MEKKMKGYYDNKDEQERDLRKTYLLQRDQFRDQKKRILLEIARLREQGADDPVNSFRISRLEKQIESERPKTQSGELVCPRCDLTSMRYIGKKYSGISIFKKERLIYSCEICGRTEKY
jgi:hypothetical protein